MLSDKVQYLVCSVFFTIFFFFVTANQEIRHVEQLKMKLFKGFTGNVMRVPKRMRIDLEYNNIICN